MTKATVRPFTAKEKAAIEAESYFASLRALEFSERHTDETRTHIADRAGMAKSTVSKILNGSARNITLKTLFLLVRAMGHKLSIEAFDLKTAHTRASNFHFAPPEIIPSEEGDAHIFITTSRTPNPKASGLYPVSA